MMIKTWGVALVVTATLLTGCVSRTAPIAAINQTLSQRYSDSQMKNTIIEAGLSRQWVMTPAGPGVINGRLTQRGHTADIRVIYSAQTYSIQYVGSQNLLAANGQIHRNYHRWVHNLDQDIQLRLAALATR
jgi:hypothetical protein